MGSLQPGDCGQGGDPAGAGGGILRAGLEVGLRGVHTGRDNISTQHIYNILLSIHIVSNIYTQVWASCSDVTIEAAEAE